MAFCSCSIYYTDEIDTSVHTSLFSLPGDNNEATLRKREAQTSYFTAVF